MRRHRKKRRKKASKFKSLKRHSRLRAAQRYGITLTREVLAELVNQIQTQSPQAEFIERQSLRVTVWRVTLDGGRQVPVAYDTHRKTLITFLPPEYELSLPPSKEPVQTSESKEEGKTSE